MKKIRMAHMLMALNMVFMLTISAFAAQVPVTVSGADLVAADGTEFLLDPATGDYLPINHIEDKIEQINSGKSKRLRI